MSAGKSYSFIVIPDDGSRTREFKASALFLRALAVLVLVGLLLVFGGGISIWRVRGWGDTLRQLRAENGRLREEVAKVQRLSQALERLKATDEQIRTMLSGETIPAEPASDSGSGAASEPASNPGGWKR